MMADESEDVEIMQFTGLTDKNGKEIYERDIVRYDTGNFGGTRAIEFRNGCFCIGGPDCGFLIGEAELTLEVIGNLYENPELLKQNPAFS